MSQFQKTAYIGLGGNIGDVRGYIEKALDMLRATDSVSVAAASPIIQTKPLGVSNQGDFCNAVAKIQTQLPPRQLWERMVEIENSLGRVRGKKWTSRTIDLDMLLYDDEVINTNSLILPHSQMHLRTFVLEGMCQLAPGLIHPVLKRSMAELKGRLGGGDFAIDKNSPQLISIAGIIGAGKTTLARALSERLACELVLEAYDKNPYLADEYAGSKDAGFDSEMFFLNSRVDQLNREILRPGRAVISDYIFDKQMIYAAQWLDGSQLETFGRSYNAAAEIVSQPVLVIYLEGSAEVCLKRIGERNRPFEQDIDMKMLEEIDAGYKELFAGWARCPVIRLVIGKFDCYDTEQIDMLAKEVNKYIWKP
jgi:deoxyguanosine kinase